MSAADLAHVALKWTVAAFVSACALLTVALFALQMLAEVTR